MEYLLPFVNPKLEHAFTLMTETRPPLGFYGWDDRLGSGAGAGCLWVRLKPRHWVGLPCYRAWCSVVDALARLLRLHPPVCAAVWTGFSNATCDEAEAAYRFLAIRSW